jgi:hypothetical protein
MDQPDIRDFPHPAFLQPSDVNATIWRYLNLDKFEWLVLNRRLYMARTDKLTDKDDHEGTTPRGELAKWQKAVAEAPDEETRGNLQRNLAQMSNYAKGMRNSYYVSCWHLAEDENVAMWDRYVSPPDAVAVRSTYATLREQLSRKIVDLGLIRYIDYEKDELPSFNMLHWIMHKRHFYSDEREVRAVVCSSQMPALKREFFDPYVVDHGLGYAPFINPQALIKGVVLHPRGSAKLEERVAAVCASAGLPAPMRSGMASVPVF